MPAVTFTTAPEQAQPVALFDRSLLSDEAQRQLTDLENELAFQFRRDAKNVYQIGSVLFHVRELIQADLKQKGIPSNQRDQGFKTWCEEQGEHPLILCGDFPNEFSIEISEVAEKWGNFDEYAIEIEDVKGGQLG